MLDVLSLLSVLFQAVGAFFGWRRDQDLMQAGEDRARNEAKEDALRKVKLVVENQESRAHLSAY